MAEYFFYVDESGDSGHNTAVTTHFVVAGFFLREGSWAVYLDKIKHFRAALSAAYNFRMRDELHARDIWMARGDSKNRGDSYAQRYRMFRDVAFFLRQSSEISIIAVSVNKLQPRLSGVNIREYAWKLLIQRFENYLLDKGTNGIVFADEGEDKLVRGQLRRMRAYNPIPSKFGGYYQQKIVRILEDPVFRESKHSYFIQLADMVAYFCRLRDNASKRQVKWRLHKMYRILKPRYLLEASRKDRYGFVYG